MKTIEIMNGHPESGGYKVDVSRGGHDGRVSSEWFSRPDDEKYLSLSELYTSVKGRAQRSKTRTVESAAIRVEGIETMLSLRCVLPTIPMAAALSANHLSSVLLLMTLRRLYIGKDVDAAGETALAALTERAGAAGIEVHTLSPQTGDFNFCTLLVALTLPPATELPLTCLSAALIAILSRMRPKGGVVCFQIT